MWNQLGSGFTIPMTQIDNSFSVDVQAFVNAQYPIDQSEPTIEIGTTTYTTETELIFKETDCFVYAGGIVFCILTMFYCNHKIK
jgi:hypothetical protein